MYWVNYFNYFAIIFFFLVNSFYFLLLLLSIKEVFVQLKKSKLINYKSMLASKMVYPISILLPVHNEQDKIIECVKSLNMLRYPEFEIIVINNGSTDKTLALLIKEFGLKKITKTYDRRIPAKDVQSFYQSSFENNLLVIDIENSTTGEALNIGLNLSRYPLICNITADSMMEDDALLRGIRYFMEEKENVIATTGTIRVANGSKIEQGKVLEVGLADKAVANIQIIEYFKEYLFGQLGWGVLKSLLILPKTFSIYKKQALLEIGGYKTDGTGEDIEVTLRMHRYMKEHKRNYTIKFTPEPICWVNVPTELNSRGEQIKQHYKDIITAFSKHRKMFFNPFYGTVGVLGMPYLLIGIIAPFIEFFSYITIITCYIIGIISLHFFILFVTLVFLYSMFISIFAIFLEELFFRRYPKVENIFRLMCYSVNETFGYRQFTAYWKVKAALELLFHK